MGSKYIMGEKRGKEKQLEKKRKGKKTLDFPRVKTQTNVRRGIKSNTIRTSKSQCSRDN